MVELQKIVDKHDHLRKDLFSCPGKHKEKDWLKLFINVEPNALTKIKAKKDVQSALVANHYIVHPLQKMRQERRDMYVR